MRNNNRVLVYWRGYKRPTWEPIKNLKHTEAFKLYERLEVAHYLAAFADARSDQSDAADRVDAATLEPSLSSTEARVRFADEALSKKHTNLWLAAA